VKHKQELAALKQEMSKLQTDSRMGQKTKDMAEKEIEGLKKKLADTDTKLKAVMADKQALSQVGRARDRKHACTCGGLGSAGGGWNAPLRTNHAAVSSQQHALT
jgi:hypothetical protein